ncbi:NUDIX domain-containing protein [Thioalkalivibrio sulfidiphilus]|uniref:NUDIX domain-containing protein n=1 Tax=Thioalkalivibrio sulfidiphilus TaxID=1033854 RepID=UPI003B2B9853
MKWEIIDDRLAYEGFFRIRSLRLSHSRFQGGDPLVVKRELLERGHAAAVLPYDARRDRIVLIEQFRVGALEAERGPWLMETIAGMIEPGERAEDVVRREALEEAGCQLGELVRLYEYHSTPGGASERVTLFVGQTDSEGVGGIHGLEHEGEDIRVHVLDAEEAFARMDSGLVDNAMTLIALLWLRLNREMLRERWA